MYKVYQENSAGRWEIATTTTWDDAKSVAKALVAQSKREHFVYHSFSVVDDHDDRAEFGDWSWRK